MSAPVVPARPARSQQPPAASANMDVPRVPPRPKRSVERSVSPNRDRFAPSPLNDLGFSNNPRQTLRPSNLATSVPQRPPSVELPSIGQEGSEYAHIHEHASGEEPDVSQQTKSVAGDLPLHAPKASLPTGVAKARVAAVTRTDSDQAAVYGIGRPASREKQHDSRPQSASFDQRATSRSSSRPQSIMKDDEEHGIPEIGVQIPLHPHAGDVQAPTPSPYDGKPYSQGVGFFNDGSGAPKGRKHERTRSGREVFAGPPGSYGLHGHGQAPRDQFESAWYEKHPEEREKEEQGAYGPAISHNRHDWALSSEELNKLVHRNVHGVGMGSSGNAIGTPDEMVGYMASEEYASRMSPLPTPTAANQTEKVGSPLGRQRASSGAAHAESPLRKMSFPVNEIDPVIKRGSSHDHALEDEADDDVIHVEPLSRSASRAQGGRIATPVSIVREDGDAQDEAPILAPDEAAKTPNAEFLQPAVPHQEEYGDFMGAVDAEGRPLYQGFRSSRPSSRSGSAAGLTRFASHDEQGTYTPLENVKEYEPLFPEDEDSSKMGRGGKQAPKRPDALVRHHFPSKDVWEDAPSSLMHVTTVESPPPGHDNKPDRPAAGAFEPPEAEEARKAVAEQDQEDFLSEHTKKLGKPFYNKDIQGEMPTRPGMERRFPSQDIWEDSPSHSLITTVVTPQAEGEQTSPQEAKKQPEIPARPAKAGVIPPRPAARAKEVAASSPEDKKAPSVPDRPKPQVPARPQKAVQRDSNEQVPLSKSISAGSGGSGAGDSTANAPKPVEGGVSFEKRAPPPKPAKQFGNLKGSFISDLQNKLQLGRQGIKKEATPPEEEKAEEKAPLADARKGRARGPQRRKPGTSPGAAAAAAEAAPAAPILSISAATSLWDIGEDGGLNVGATQPTPAIAPVSGASPARSVSVGPAEDENPTPPLKVESSSPEATAEGYFNALSPEASTKAAARRASPPSAAVPDAAEAGAAAPPAEEVESPSKSVQTGQKDIEYGFDEAGSKKEKMTAYVEGRAQGGSVVVKEKEKDGDPELAAAAAAASSPDAMADPPAPADAREAS